MAEIVQDLLQLAKNIHKKHSDSFSFVSVSVQNSKDSFLITDNDVSFELIDEKGLCEIGLEPVLGQLNADYLSEPEILEALENAKIKKREIRLTSTALLHAIGHRLTEYKYVAHIHSKITNRLLCSKLAGKPFLGHIYQDSVIHCGKTIAVIPFVESAYFLAKTISQELKNYKKQYFLSPKVLLIENYGHFVFGSTRQSTLDTINTLEDWSDLLSNIFAFSSPKYLSHEQIIAIEKNERERQSFLSKEV